MAEHAALRLVTYAILSLGTTNEAADMMCRGRRSEAFNSFAAVVSDADMERILAYDEVAELHRVAVRLSARVQAIEGQCAAASDHVSGTRGLRRVRATRRARRCRRTRRRTTWMASRLGERPARDARVDRSHRGTGRRSPRRRHRRARRQ